MNGSAPTTADQPTSLADIPEYRGLLSWITSIDHKQIGIMYILSSFFFLVLGVGEAITMRLQLIRPMNDLISPEMYNQIFTMHGTTMIFLMAMPLLFGFSVYFVPLMIGARDMAFPRLNALGYWLYLFAGLMMYFSFMAGGAPADGWFSYAPLTEKGYSFSPGIDYWALGLLVAGAGSVATGINLIVTILQLRTPGMTLRRVPLFVWMVFINAFLVVLAIPALNAALVMIFTDRQLNAHFFSPAHGGSALLWQNYFWTFGHPEVYILVLPAFGVISEVIPVFSRKVIYGYGFMAASTVAIGFLSFGVWMHHMFATGLGFRDAVRLCRQQHADRRPDRHQDLELDRHDVGRFDPFQDSHAVCHSVFDPVHGRRAEWSDVCRHTDRLAVDRQLLRGRSHSLRVAGRHSVRHVCGDLLLVPENDGAATVGEAGAVEFLADGDRIQRHVCRHALVGRVGDAAPRVHLSRSSTTRWPESVFHDLRVRARARPARVLLECICQSSQRSGGGAQSVERLDAGMGHQFAATAREFSARSTGQRAASAVGS